MQPKEHWEQVYASRPAARVSWYQEHAAQSLLLVRATRVPLSASVIDVGGGASTLVDDLSAAAMSAARSRLGERSAAVTWLEADIVDARLPSHGYDVWHDRAVFHFLTGEHERKAYVSAVLRAVRPGGHVIVATFAEDGPTQCSGLPVMRYSPQELHAEFGASFTLMKQEREEHHTPFGTSQKFIYCYCRLASS